MRAAVPRRRRAPQGLLSGAPAQYHGPVIGACLSLLAGALFGAAPVPPFDVAAALARPGTRLLAVELYATWCKPCMAAVPRWRDLHARHRADGLRLVVVATRDPDGRCANPGWTPDEVICDQDGMIAEQLGVHGLPAAFLWSWQGELLVANGHVDAVGAAVEAWIAQAPRVRLSVHPAPRGAVGDRAALEAILVSEIVRAGKLSVVADDATRAELERLKAVAFEPRYDEALRCELGRALPPNSLLDARVVAGAGAPWSLELRLASAERGCLLAAASVPWSSAHPEVAVRRSMERLFGALQVAPAMPLAAPARAGPAAAGTASRLTARSGAGASRGAGAADPAGATGEALLVANVDSTPAGAAVTVDGERRCEATPCHVLLVPGPHRIRCALPGLPPDERTVQLDTDALRVRCELTPAGAALAPGRASAETQAPSAPRPPVHAQAAASAATLPAAARARPLLGRTIAVLRPLPSGELSGAGLHAAVTRVEGLLAARGLQLKPLGDGDVEMVLRRLRAADAGRCDAGCLDALARLAGAARIARIRVRAAEPSPADDIDRGVQVEVTIRETESGRTVTSGARGTLDAAGLARAAGEATAKVLDVLEAAP